MKTIPFFTILAIAIFMQTTHAQSQHKNTKFQVEYSLNQNSASNMHGIDIHYADHAESAYQAERPASYLAVTQIRDLNRWFAVRYGLSLADRGYREDITISNLDSFEESSKNIRMHYLGTPLLVSFNLKNNKKLISGFIETGISPELLLNQTRSDYMNYDLNRVGLNGIVNLGMKVNFHDNYSLVISPGFRYALNRYDTEPGQQPSQIRDFRPFSANLTIGFQF